MEVFVGQSAQSTLTTGTHDNISADSSTVALATLYAVSRNTTVDAASGDIGHGLGMTDGTIESAIGWGVDNAQGTSDCSQIRRPDVVCSCSSSSQVADGRHNHNSFIAGGHRVDRSSNGFGQNWFANHMHFADCNVAVEEGDLSASVDTAINLDPGFVWDVVICISNNLGGTSDETSDAQFSFGFYVRGDDDQGCMIWGSNHNQATPGDNSMFMSTNYAAGLTNAGSGSLTYGVEISTGSGTSCDLTTRDAGGSGNRVTCLFIGFTGSEIAKIVEWSSPTSTGSDVQTGLGIAPIALINLISYAEAYNSAEADSDGGAYGISFETADSQFCLAGADENGSDPSDSQSYIDDQAINVAEDDGSTTNALIATLTSLDSDGWEHNFTTVNGSARRFLTLAIGDSSSDISGTILKAGLFRS